VMFVLDTNVLSELMNPAGAPKVLRWVDRMREDSLFTTALNQAEILYGIAILGLGRRQRNLIAAADAMFNEEFRGRILAFDERAAGHYAAIASHRRTLGQPAGMLDTQVAAIARANAMTVVTRNVRHFEASEVPVIDPWTA
jgi:toxin FitB